MWIALRQGFRFEMRDCTKGSAIIDCSEALKLPQAFKLYMVPKVRRRTCIRDLAVFDIDFCSTCGIFLFPPSYPMKRRRSALHSSTVGLNWVCWTNVSLGPDNPRLVTVPTLPCSHTPRSVSESGLRSHTESATLQRLSLVLSARPWYVLTRMHDPSGRRVWARAHNVRLPKALRHMRLYKSINCLFIC